jgi:16S rRNA (guanine527-N7)-methyltransferase
LAPLEDLTHTFALGEEQAWALGRYVDLLSGWRRANLSGLKSREDLIDILLGDSLALLDVPALAEAGPCWLDLGAGAGIPGIPLAIAARVRPRLTLLEATRKKCDFLREAVIVAGLAERATVVCGRSEEYAEAGRDEGGRERHDVVLARAVAPLATLVELAAPLLAPGGLLLASKTRGAADAEEAAGAEATRQCGMTGRALVPLPRSPLRDAVCVVLEKTAPAPEWLPRRPGMAAKRPLAG